MVILKQVTIHSLASRPNRPDDLRQALREFEDDLHTGGWEVDKWSSSDNNVSNMVSITRHFTSKHGECK